MRRTLLAAASSFLASAFFLTGCSTSFAPGPVTPVQTAFGNISGYAHGGQQPIIGATVEALQTSTTAYGGASTVLATTTTSAESGGNPATEGYFSFPASTTCTSGAVVYLYSIGGQPTTGVTNSAAGELAVLGTCPSSGLLDESIAGVSPPVQIYMNEVSTVAAAYALAGFAINSSNVSTNATSIGALTTATAGGPVTDTLAQTGIQNAAANAAQMYTAVATSDGGGANNGSIRAALATTPNGNGTVPQAEIDTIANILAACINSTGPGSSACTTLFSDDRGGGGSTGAQPTDTATAALYLAQHPYSANVTALFNLVGSTADPFTPALSTAPANYTVSLAFTGGGITGNTEDSPRTIGIDGNGNIWKSNLTASSMTELNPLGVPATGSPFTGNHLSYPAGLSIDTANNVWAANYNADYVSVFSSTGAIVGAYNASITDPKHVAFDASGNAWVANAASVVKISSTGTLLEGPETGNGIAIPYAIAVAPGVNGLIWVANEGGDDASAFTPSGAAYSGTQYTGLHDPISVAIDSTGDVWYANDTKGVVELSSTGALIAATTVGALIDSVAIDGSGSVWVTDTSTDNVYELNSSGALTNTFAPLPAGAPDSIAIDGSGNVWYSMYSTGTIRELIGAAVPVATPIAYGTANSKLGVRP